MHVQATAVNSSVAGGAKLLKILNLDGSIDTFVIDAASVVETETKLKFTGKTKDDPGTVKSPWTFMLRNIRGFVIENDA